MSTAEPEDMFGVDAYVLGLKVVFWAYALMIALRVVGPALGLLSAASTRGLLSSDAAEVGLAILVIVVLILLFVGLFLATFLFVSAHNVDVVLTSRVAASGDVQSATGTNPEVSGGVAIVPELFFPPDLAPLLYLLPPALLIYAGYREWQVEEDATAAVTKVVAGYGIVALGTIVPVAWLFNSFVGPFVGDLASSALVETTVRVEYPSIVAAHLIVGVVYPVVFGGAGAVLAQVTDDSRRPGRAGTAGWDDRRGRQSHRQGRRNRRQRGHQQAPRQEQRHHQQGRQGGQQQGRQGGQQQGRQGGQQQGRQGGHHQQNPGQQGRDQQNRRRGRRDQQDRRR